MTINQYSNINNLSKCTKAIMQCQKKLSQLSNSRGLGFGAENDIKMTRFESDIRGMQQGNKNIQDGVSLIQVASDSIKNIQDIGQQLRELATEYNNETLSNEDKKIIENEAKAYYKEIGNIIDNTTFNGIKIFSKNTFKIQTGANTNDTYTINLNNLGTILKDICDKVENSSTTDKDNNGGNGNNGNDSIDGDNNGGNGNNGNGSIDGDNNGGNGNNGNGSIDGDNNGGNGNNGIGGVDGDNNGNVDNTPNNSTNNYHNYLEYVIKNAQNVIENVDDGWTTVTGDNGWRVEGDIKNSNLNNFNRVYNEKGELVFEGDFTTGKVNGFGRLYKDNNILAEGNFSDNMITGWGKITYDDNSYYTGYMSDEKRQGWGTYVDKDNNYYIGEWNNDEMDGYSMNKSAKTINKNELNIASSMVKSNILGAIDEATDNISKINAISSDKENSINNFLDVDFIDKNLLSITKEAISSLNIQERILGYRTNLNDSKIETYSKNVNVKNTDTYLEILSNLYTQMNKYNVNTTLMSQSISLNRDNIINLLNII